MSRIGFVALLLALGCGGAQRPGEASHAPVHGERPLDAREQASFDDVIRWAERTRGLTLRAPVPTSVADVETMDRLTLGSLLDEAASARHLTDATLGMVPSVAESIRLTEALSREQALGAYVPGERRIVVREDVLASLGGTSNQDRLDQATMLHEVVHALQHQRLFAQETLEEDLDLDAALALRSLIEGDATLAMVAAIARSTGAELSTLVADGRFVEAVATEILSVHEGSEAAIDAAPPVLRMRTMGPYLFGASFAAARYRSGGWVALDAVYARPPRSTTEVLHPERYEAGFRAEALALPELPLPDSLEPLDETTYGELLLRAYFAPLGTERAATAAEGWSGDRLRTYRRADGRGATVWVVSCATIRDAVELADAARRLGRHRTPEDASAHAVERMRQVVVILDGLDPEERESVLDRIDSWLYE